MPRKKLSARDRALKRHIRQMRWKLRDWQPLTNLFVRWNRLLMSRRHKAVGRAIRYGTKPADFTYVSEAEQMQTMRDAFDHGWPFVRAFEGLVENARQEQRKAGGFRRKPRLELSSGHESFILPIDRALGAKAALAFEEKDGIKSVVLRSVQGLFGHPNADLPRFVKRLAIIAQHTGYRRLKLVVPERNLFYNESYPDLVDQWVQQRRREFAGDWRTWLRDTRARLDPQFRRDPAAGRKALFVAVKERLGVDIRKRLVLEHRSRAVALKPLDRMAAIAAARQVELMRRDRRPTFHELREVLEAHQARMRRVYTGVAKDLGMRLDASGDYYVLDLPPPPAPGQ